MSGFLLQSEKKSGAAPTTAFDGARSPQLLSLLLACARASEDPAADIENEQPVALPSLATGWTHDAEKELRKIPFFVRGKAKRNTEHNAAEQGIATITIETLYDAKSHFAR